jgi:tetratricopeptide (TPR) repeat protein
MEDINKGLTALFALVSLPVLAALFFIIRGVYRNTIGKKMQTTLREDYQNEADRFEKAGRFVSAAQVYETKLKDLRKAAALYERGGDYRKASSLYDLLGVSGKAKEMYEKDGNIDDAAEVSIREGEFEEAARLYRKSGKKIDEAVIMEKAGRRLPAIRAYREAGDYRNAARLLEAEGMITEATEMFGLMLRDKSVEPSTISDFYDHAFRLEKTGQADKALEIYRQIDAADPTYKDVREKIQTLSPAGEEEEEAEASEGAASVRSFIKSGKIEPKYGFKLWFQILRSLQDAHARGRAYGLLSPENILIDARNNISFLKKAPSSAYRAPEKAKDLELDVRADIFSMGVILYELLTGSLEGLGSVRVMDAVHDVPEWLDEIVIKCIRKVREDRYQSIDQILEDIRNLSRSKKEPEPNSDKG